jgi:hypothetical protein
MALSLLRAVRDGWLGDSLSKRAHRTLPGQLAAFVDKLIYDAQEEKAAGPHAAAKVFVYAQTRVSLGADGPHGKPFPGFAGLDDKGEHAETVRALREVHDYLLACAVREATKG